LHVFEWLSDFQKTEALLQTRCTWVILKYDDALEDISSFKRGGAGGLESSCAVKASMVGWKKLKGLLTLSPSPIFFRRVTSVV
jgi:hypothetical protein